MIEIIGEPGNPEHEAALQVRDALVRLWPGIDTSPSSDEEIKIASRLKLSGQKVSDIDIVVVGLITTRRYLISKYQGKDSAGSSLMGAKVRVKSFVIAVEVKDHPADGLSIQAGGVSVKYRTGWKSATEQNEAQRYALLGYLRDTTNTNPWVHRTLILRGIEDLPKHRGLQQPTSGAVAAKFDGPALLMSMATNSEVQKHGSEYVISSGDEETMQRVLASALFQPLAPSDMDRKRMDRIAARPIEAKELAARLGEERVHLRGNGGTGKTILLLQSAYEAFLETGKRSLVLTYNTALTSDIQRTLALMGIPSDGEAGGISIRTVISFMYSWLHRLGLVDDGGLDLKHYDGKCVDALSYIEKGAIGQEEIDAIRIANPTEFSFDIILVDEAQDWPQAEAALLIRLYGPSKISLADGLSQLIRGAPTDWRSPSMVSKHPEVKTLREGLRMKANLCRFANAIADDAGLQWHVTPNKLAPGGRIIIVEGQYAEMADLQRDVQAGAMTLGNMPVDLLHCVPPSGVLEQDGRRSSMLAKAFVERGWQAWDAVDEATRRTFPRSRESLRIVQYESCRGLEGWSVVLDGLDEFWQRKKADELGRLVATGSGDVDPELQAEAIAWRWLMIPITRPIDTLVIAIRDRKSPLSRSLDRVASIVGDIIEYR
jgi:hypothetical protein